MTDCAKCADTGRLEGSNYLDCGYCEVASERASLQEWAVSNVARLALDDAQWKIYQHGRQDGKTAILALLEARRSTP